MPLESFGNAEERDVGESPHGLESDDFLIELLHRIEIIDAQGDLAQSSHRTP